MWLARMLLIVVTASLPVAAGAVDVDFGAMVEGGYDSNIYRTRENQVDDGLFRFTPTIRFEVPGRKFSGDLYYAPTYELFTTHSDANGMAHVVLNGLNWAPDEKTHVRLSNRFQALNVLNFNDPSAIDGGTTPIPDNDIRRERVYLFGSGLTIEHAISPRWNSATSANFNLFESKDRFRSDTKTISAFQSFQYGVTASDRVGGGGGFNVQLFDAVPGRLPASNSYVYQLFASYSRNFGERTILSIQAGPALIHTIQDSGFAASEPDSDVIFVGSNEGSNDMSWTIFGEVGLTHYWLPTLTSAISYNRRQSPANGQGASTVADSVLFQTNWQPSERWDLSLRATYVHRESLTNLSQSNFLVGEDGSLTFFDVNVSRAVDTDRWGIMLRAARRITRRISSSIRFSYSDQRSKNTDRSPNDFGNFLAIVGIKYDFDRFRF
jgi:hypothetical protein